MGLDISHGAWSAPYGALSQWREQLAAAAGYWVLPVAYDPPLPNGLYAARSTVMIDWGHLEEGVYQGKWKTEPKDPLLYLICHSDCDGSLSPKRARLLADRIEELLPIVQFEQIPGMPDYWEKKTRHFIEGCRRAVAARQSLKFR